MAGAPPGNQNAAKSRKFEQAITRSLAADDYQKLRAIADNVVDLAAAGERWAVEMLRDTLDGKPAQAVTLSGDDTAPPVAVKATVEFVNASPAPEVT